MSSPATDKLCIILVEPQFPGNVGMVCRAMKNMGITRLRLVAGCDHHHPDARMFAVSAGDILDQAECFDNLAEALSDITTSIATTRRSGKYRQELLTPPQAAQTMLQSPGKAALVFGREDHGLSTSDLSLCSLQATIAASSEYGSLNLAQAVLLFCYELFGAAQLDGQAPQQRQQAPSGELEPFFQQMKDTLQRIGFLNPQNPEHIMRSLRRIMFRATLDSREVALLRGMFSQIDWASANFSDRKKSS